MAARSLRILLLADTHLGLCRAGVDHDGAYQRALLPALRGEVDLLVHGGDVFFRSRVKPGVVLQAFEPLKKIADSGVPVIVVPGNHERSAIPFPLLAAHPGIHIFDRPRTFTLDVRGVPVAVAGFPNDRDHIRERFHALVEQTEWRSARAAVRVLCMHQTVEGATVGPANFTFYSRSDVIPARAFPSGFTAVLSGHIHRHQVITTDLQRRPLAAPVFYPGSTERTSGAERNEAKGYMTIEIDTTHDVRIRDWGFHELDAPMSLP